MSHRRSLSTNKNLVRFLLFTVALLICGIFFYFLEDKILKPVDNNTVQKLSGYIFLIAAGVFGFLNYKDIFENKNNSYILIGGYLFSCFLFLVFSGLFSFPIWLAGGIICAVLVDLSIGLFICYFFVLQAFYYINSTFLGLLYQFVFATAFCFLLRYFYIRFFPKKKAAVFVNIEEQEEEEKNKSDIDNRYTYLESVASSLSEINIGQQNETQQVINIEEQEEKIVETSIPEINENDRAKNEEEIGGNGCEELEDITATEDYTPYCDEKAPLMLQLKETKKSVYLHSLRIALISESCAKLIGADRFLAKACGLYHEIGKIREGNVYENTYNITVENEFPPKLIHALDECNNKHSNSIGSKEAAIVSITDTIMTTFYFFKGQKKEILPENIIDKAISKTMFNGRLNESGLSLKECAQIRTFFIDKLSEFENK